MYVYCIQVNILKTLVFFFGIIILLLVYFLLTRIIRFLKSSGAYCCLRVCVYHKSGYGLVSHVRTYVQILVHPPSITYVMTMVRTFALVFSCFFYFLPFITPSYLLGDSSEFTDYFFGGGCDWATDCGDCGIRRGPVSCTENSTYFAIFWGVVCPVLNE